MPFVPITLVNGVYKLEEKALVDTGSMLNVLPHSLGISLGFVWDSRKAIFPLSGSASSLAMLVKLTATIPNLTPVELGFGWAGNDNYRLILGQTNFLAEYHVCFYQDKDYFEITAK
jgi:hypothetical protein